MTEKSSSETLVTGLNKIKKMKITFLGQELDTTKEHELCSENQFGFKVEIKMTKESWYPQKELTIYNCTEVHHLWSKDYMGGASIAFESDIHGTGFTRRIDDIESVTITLAEKLHASYNKSEEV